MMTSDNIINASEADFEYEVLTYSQQIPVVVDFWAEWCGPCRSLGPMLEKLAKEGQGSFRLAKVNVDENNSLAIRYGIHSIPAVRAFRDGKIVAEFNGLVPEDRLREFMQSISPSEGDLALEKALSLLALSNPEQAEISFREALTLSPNSTLALLGLSKSLLRQGKVEESYQLVSNFPVSREFSAAQSMLPLLQNLSNSGQGKLAVGDTPLDAAFERCLQLVKRGNLEAAMDGLLDILREDKGFRNGQVRQTMVGLLELLGPETPLSRQYRAELASILF
jgi:putative thioredoxin